ncbi:immunoglobulin domain-containing protein [Bacteroidota bacterium]
MKKYYLLFLLLFPISLFAQTWVSVGGGVGRNLTNYTICNNELYVISNDWFSNTSRVNKWNGNSWDTIGAMFTNGDITALAAVNNDLYALFEDQNSKVLKWTGTTWITIGITNNYTQFLVNCNDHLYIGGALTEVDSVAVNYIAEWNGNTWEALQSGLDKPPGEFIVYNNELYVIGNFTKAGSVNVNYIAKWDGSTWKDVGGGFVSKKTYGLDGSYSAVYNGELYVSDINLVSAGGVLLNSIIARWDGTNWDSVGTGGPLKNDRRFAELDGKLYCLEFVCRGGKIETWDGINWSVLNVDNSIVDTMMIRKTFVFDNELYNIGEIYLNGFNPEGIVKMENLPINITLHPQNQTICEFENVTFNVAANGKYLKYQWKFNNNPISNAKDSFLTILSCTITNAGKYSCEISDSSFSITSNEATLIVGTGPAITTQPASKTVMKNDPVTFNLVASGINLTYQWKKNGTEISGVTTSSYTINSVSYTDSGIYSCVVTDKCGTVTSDEASLSVSHNIGIEELNENFRVYPNPTTEEMHISLGNSYKEVILTVKDLAGKIVSKQHFSNVSEIYSEIEGANGIYFAEIRTPEGFLSILKVIKK